MIDKIIFTQDSKIDQLEFIMPVGYTLYATDNTVVSSSEPSVIDFGVRVFSRRPATFIYTPAIQSIDFRIIDPIQMIGPNIQTPLKISILNPCKKEQDWIINEGDLVATLLVVETYAVNLFEVSNKTFKQYV